VNLDLANNAPRLSKIKGWIEDSNCAAWVRDNVCLRCNARK